MEKSEFIWMDGKFVDWDDAKIHILTHTLHYGNGVFEGTRAYNTDRGLAIFRLKDHTKRLFDSAKILKIDIPFSVKDIELAQVELLKKNNFNSNIYIRPIVYLGYGAMGVHHINAPVNVSIASWKWGAYLGDDGIENGIRVKISSFARNSIKSSMGKAKASANYLNSQMAKYEAIECGYEEALLLDENGFVAEGSGECFFIIKDDVIITPPHDNTLKSITQSTVIEIAKNMGYDVQVRNITRDEVYICDEAFFTGTAAEVTPIKDIDNRVVGNGSRGKITKILQEKYFNIVYGRDKNYDHYLTYIN
jgi:branched-chain amino acid aminotransferase